jgi:hypothetical protein
MLGCACCTKLTCNSLCCALLCCGGMYQVLCAVCCVRMGPFTDQVVV